MDTNRTSRSHSADTGKSGNWLGCEQAQRAAAGREYFLAYPKRRPALGSASQQDSDELAGAERLGAMGAKSFSGPLGGWKLSDSKRHPVISVCWSRRNDAASPELHHQHRPSVIGFVRRATGHDDRLRLATQTEGSLGLSGFDGLIGFSFCCLLSRDLLRRPKHPEAFPKNTTAQANPNFY
jgi:hypothetical protein